MVDYELLEHTADIGVRLKAKDLEELFKNAALAMFEIIAEEKSNIKYKKLKIEKITVRQEAENKEELFVNWLNELLSLSSAKEIIFTDFKIHTLSETTLEAAAIGESIGNFKVNTEIKAATYHELKIEKIHSGCPATKASAGWQAEVIFDV